MKRATSVGVGGSRRIVGNFTSGISFNIHLEHGDFVRMEDGTKLSGTFPLVRIVGEFRSVAGESLFQIDLGTLDKLDFTAKAKEEGWQMNFDKIRAVLEEAEDQLGIMFESWKEQERA